MSDINFAYLPYAKKSRLGLLCVLLGVIVISSAIAASSVLHSYLHSVNREITHLEAKISVLKKTVLSKTKHLLSHRHAHNIEQLLRVDKQQRFCLKEFELKQNSCSCTLIAENSAGLSHASKALSILDGVKESRLVAIARNNNYLTARYELSWTTKEAKR